MIFNFLFFLKKDGLDTPWKCVEGWDDWEISVDVATNEMGCVREPGWKVLEPW